jgi:peptide/nickel transport system permease protein
MAMIRCLLRRTGHSGLVLFGVSILTFVFLQLAPGDFLTDARVNPNISPETVQGLRLQYGLDLPLPQRYARWLWAIGHGDLGYSFAYNMPVASLLLPRAMNTLLLSATALVAGWTLAVSIGIWTATRSRRWLGRAFGIVSSLLLAVPDLVIALLLLTLAVKSRWLPTGGMMSASGEAGSTSEQISDLLRHLLLPAVAITAGILPVLARHVHSAVAEGMNSEFVRAARAHGLPGWRITLWYIVPAAANPLLTLFGLSVATLLSMSLLIEVVFGWPGMGPLFFEAILGRDVFVVVGAVLLSACFLQLGNLLGDVLLYAADPRIRRTA